MVIDSHFHPQFLKPAFKENFSSCIEQARLAGVSKLIAVSVNFKEDQLELENFANEYENLYYSLGVHPLYISDNIKEFSIPVNPKFVALGETGLDYKNDISDFEKEMQRNNFRMHLHIAKINNLPIIIHTRYAESDTISIIKEFPGVRGVFHCFTGSLHMALEAIALGFYISFSGIITFNSKSVDDLKYIVKHIPIESILVETDSPYLTPAPYRGKYPNEPKNTMYVLKQVCALKAIDFLTAAKQIKDNTIHLFNLYDK